MACRNKTATAPRELVIMDRKLTELGARVKAARMAQGWTVKEAAKLAGVAPNTFTSVELGRGTRPGNLRAVLDLVGIEPLADTREPDPDEGVRLALDLVEQWLHGIDDDAERTRAVHELTRFVMIPR